MIHIRFILYSLIFFVVVFAEEDCEFEFDNTKYEHFESFKSIYRKYIHFNEDFFMTSHI